MPSKSVREMTVIERAHYSIQAKTFRGILLFSLILSIAAIAFGFALYLNEVQMQCRNKVSDLSQTIAGLVDGDLVAEYTAAVFEIRNSADEAVPADADSEAFAALFDGMKDGSYEEVVAQLSELRIKNELESVFIGLPDENNERFVYVINSDPGRSFRTPGNSVALSEKDLSIFNEDTTALSAVFLRESDGIYSCAAATPIYASSGKLAAYVVCTSNLSGLMKQAATFLWQHVILLAIITIVMAILMTRRLKRDIVAPLNQLAEAAEAYVADRKSGSDERRHFADLKIDTGDELENLGLIMADMEQEIVDYEGNLSRVTAEKERIGTELSVASGIQEGILPNIFPPFPGRQEFDIYAAMYPAKEVGGDFYDFFLIDDDHLGIVMADVSGKGVPAALFMMFSKILISNISKLVGTAPAQILEQVNHQICMNNSTEMFVTCWLGILEISTGRVKAANAGHEYPVLQKAGGQFALIRDRHGFVLGGLEGIRYKEYELILEPGDALFLYTDGVTEATNVDNVLFGNDRMLAALNADPTMDMEGLVVTMKSEIDRFVGDTPQFDDITMLGIRYNGDVAKKLTIGANVENLGKVTAFVDEELEKAGCSMRTQMQIDVAVEELFVNICSYAYAPGSGNAVIGVRIEGDPARAVISFADSGIPYNPLEKDDPDVTLSAEEREVGGLGIYMVKKSMDEMLYEYRDGQNLLIIKKTLS